MSGLATPIARTQRVLDELPARSVVIDGQGDAWQQGTVGEARRVMKAHTKARCVEIANEIRELAFIAAKAKEPA